ncbi:MAG: DKNYY domain-containing protein [bacterium]|nr:DKNYY domain-containing protein [bacterium]
MRKSIILSARIITIIVIVLGSVGLANYTIVTKKLGINIDAKEETPISPTETVASSTAQEIVPHQKVDKHCSAFQCSQPPEILCGEDIKWAEISTLIKSTYYFPTPLWNGERLYYQKGLCLFAMTWGDVDIPTFTVLADFYGKDKYWFYSPYETGKPTASLDELNHPPVKITKTNEKTFEPLQFGYAKDKNFIYYHGIPYTYLDVRTFIILNKYYAKDSVSVLYNGKKIPANASTFSLFEKAFPGWAKDKDRLFYNGTPLIVNLNTSQHPLDIQSFIVLSDYYAKDAANIYYFHTNWKEWHEGLSEINTLQDVDVKTFIPLGNHTLLDEYKYEKFASVYARDAFHVFFFGKILPGVDVSTFEFIAGASCPINGRCRPFVAKDKNCIYILNQKVLNAYGSCANPTKCTKETVENNCKIKSYYKSSLNENLLSL